MSYNIEGKYKLEDGKEEIFDELTLIQFLELLNELESEGLHFSINVNFQHHVD